MSVDAPSELASRGGHRFASDAQHLLGWNTQHHVALAVVEDDPLALRLVLRGLTVRVAPRKRILNSCMLVPYTVMVWWLASGHGCCEMC